MMSLRDSQQGLTLLEVMLVLAVGVSIIVLSIQQYANYRRDADVAAIKTDVAILFNAMGRYFQTVCKSPTYSTYYSNKSVPITINLLVSTDALNSKDAPKRNPLVDYSTNSTGFILQFNQLQVTNPSGLPLPQRMGQLSSGSSVSMGNIVVWQAQVAVNLRDPNTAPQYKEILEADCLSSSTGLTVTPCASASSGATQFAVWTSLPNATGTEPNNYWLTMPMVKQFNQMYTTYPILVLTDGTKTTTQYYQCGT